MKKPFVSIIVPTKNSATTIGACLKSIENQTYKDIEMIVVDNNSTDRTKEIAGKYTKLVFNKGPERSAQRNYGVSKSKGEFIYFVDADFVLNKNVVSQCLAEIQFFFSAIIVHNSPDVTVSWIAKVRKFEVDMYKYNLDHSAARFFKKSVFEKIGGYNVKITAGEDYDIQNKLNRKGYVTGFIDAEAIHLGEPTSFWKHMLKYYNYGKDFVNYQKVNNREAGKQLTPFRDVYFRNWKKFIKQPVVGLEFVFYIFFKFAFGGIGYFTGKIKNFIS